MEIINENGEVFLKGLLSEADKRNGNGRVYPWKVWLPAMEDFRKRVETEPQSIYAELEHPPRNTIDRNQAAGLITEVTINKRQKNARCKVKILNDTLQGRQILEMIEKGEKVGISTRGRGTLNEEKIVESIHFITADIVRIPSCQVCYLSESVGEMIANDFLLEYDQSNDLLQEAVKEEMMLAAFKRLLR